MESSQTLSKDVFELAQLCAPADAADALISLMGKDNKRVITGLQVLSRQQFFGQAVTLRCLPARNEFNVEIEKTWIAAHGVREPASHAMDLCDATSVLVVEAGAQPDLTIGGGTKFSSLARRGCRALITDGALRDSREFLAYHDTYGMNVAVNGWTVQFASGWRLSSYETQVPVAVNGALVLPGDFIFGDSDGIVVIPEHHVLPVMKGGVILAHLNAYTVERAEATNGTFNRDILKRDPAALAALIERLGYQGEDLDLFHRFAGNPDAAR